MKKYVEYPFSTMSQLTGAFQEISCYLKKGAYIIHYLDRTVISDDISMDRRMIHFISKDLAGDMKEERVSFDEYCNRFLSIENQRDIMRFDVYSYINDTDIHQKHTPRNKIGYMDEISCLLGQHNLVVDSMQILCEWYQLLLETLNQRQNVSLDENKYLVNAGDMELFLNMPKRNSRNYLHNLIRRFNYLIQRIEQLSEGEEHD